MKIILCSAKDPIRERWRSLLQGQQFSIYQVSSLPMLQTVVHKDEQYLLLVHQPFMDLQTIATICRKSALYKVFVLSDTPNREEGFALLQREAVGYANTYISGSRLVEAVKVIQSGRVWFSQEVLSQFIQAVAAHNQGAASEDSAKLLQSLTEREREIALLVARGLSNKAIGEQLNVAERTVKAHLSSIFAKTGAQSRLKLALLING